MHGLAHYAKRLGLVPKNQQTQKFAQLFWENLTSKGRVNELKFSLAMYFKDGFGQGVKNAMAMQSTGMGLMKAKRLNAMEMFGGHKCKEAGAIQKMVAKAREIEDRRRGLA
jgi:quinone-modifying oxidoreductase subunit QmoC